MRILKHLSPSALSKFYNNREEFYLRYLCPYRSPRTPQADYMAVGSGFDAFIKNQIYRDVFGDSAVKGTAFEFDRIFENQVEEHNRDKTLIVAGDIWEQYVDSGAYAHLLKDIVLSPYAPQMEWRVQAEIQGIPMLGLPDLRYITKEGIHVICDFKVNGSCSKTGASPFKGYKVAWDVRRSNTHGKCHKNYEPMQFGDVEINKKFLEEFCDYWADQLSVYAWLLGESIGSEDFVVRMEQLCMRPVKSRELPRGKFATHMSRVSELFQLELFGMYQTAWHTVQSGHIFHDLTKEESDEKVEILDGMAQAKMGMFPALSNCQNQAPRFYQSKGNAV